MLRLFSQKLVSELVKKPGQRILSPDAQNAIFCAARRVRGCDFVYNFDVANGEFINKTVTTRSNWFFILTNAAVYWDTTDINNLPRVSIDFPNYSPSSPFSSEIKELLTVPTKLVFGSEDSAGRYEEPKNILYALGKTFSIGVSVKPNPAQYVRGCVLLSGLEIDVDEES